MAGIENLIPGLPDEIALLCLARISHGSEGIPQAVSKGWRDAFKSQDMARIRALEGLSGDWLFLQTDQRPAVGWHAYDPTADRWHPLPPAPGFSPDARYFGFRCVVVRRRLLVLGGTCMPLPSVLSHKSPAGEQISDRIVCFDPFSRQWSKLPGMKTPRVDFACAAIGGRVLVAGGGTATAESFDVERNTWEALMEMPEALERCRALSYNGEFQVVGYNSEGVRRHFVLGTNGWTAAAREVPPLLGIETAEMGGRLYGILNEGLAVLNEDTGEWGIISEPVFFDVPGHDRRLAPSGPGLVGMKGRLYLAGGVGIKYNAETRAFTVVKFSAARYCNISAGSHLRWHNARSIEDACGSVLACAALQQE